jgi:hypothetical protein
MALTRITAPAAPVITLEEARAHLRIDACGSPPEHPDDALIESMVAIATSELDGADGWLGRALVDQTWLLTLDRFSRWPGCQLDWLFPSGTTRIYLPLTSPQYSGASPAPDPVTSVTYVDTDGVTITMVDGTDYRVVTDHDPMYIEPVYGASWPATRDTSGAVRIIYEPGYGAAGSDVPAIIRNYMLVRIGQLYEFRELVIAGSTVAEVPYYRDSLENVRMRGYS